MCVCYDIRSNLVKNKTKLIFNIYTDHSIELNEIFIKRNDNVCENQFSLGRITHHAWINFNIWNINCFWFLTMMMTNRSFNYRYISCIRPIIETNFFFKSKSFQIKFINHFSVSIHLKNLKKNRFWNFFLIVKFLNDNYDHPYFIFFWTNWIFSYIQCHKLMPSPLDRYSRKEIEWKNHLLKTQSNYIRTMLKIKKKKSWKQHYWIN